MIGYLGRGAYAHRLSYEVFRGPIPAGMYVMHTCDNPPCINPDHLRVGTQSDNMRDASEKARMPRGETATNAKLTKRQAEKVAALYATGEFSMREVGERFGVSYSAVGSIIRGENWKHLGVAFVSTKGRGSPGDKNPARLYPERLARGESHPRCRISDEKTKELRSLYPAMSQKALAERFGISQTQVGRILRGESRRSV